MLFKFKKIGLLLICLVFSIYKGRAVKKINSPKKILIIQMAKLGDMVCTTPMFRAVKNKYPNVELIVVGNKINKDILNGDKNVDKYLVFDGLLSVFKKIKKEKIDFACITSPDFISLCILYLANIKTIVVPEIKNGYSPYEIKEYKILRKFVLKSDYKMGFYAPREYLKLLEPIDVFTSNTKKYLYFSENANKKTNDYFTKNQINKNKDLIIGISPSAGNKIKKWSGCKFAEIVAYVYKKYSAKIIIIGAKRDEKEVEEMINFLDEDIQFFNSLNMFNIDELKALVSKMDLFISVDTGPIYIAEAFDVATIDIVGPMDENEQPPVGKVHRVVIVSDRKKPELHIMNARRYNKEEARRQIDEITAKMVIKEIDYLLSILCDKK